MLSGETDELNNQQIKDFESGKPIEFSGASGNGRFSNETMDDIAAMESIDFEGILAEQEAGSAPTPTINLGAPTEIPSTPAAPVNRPAPFGGFAQEGDEHDDRDDIIIQSGVTEMHRFKLPRPIKTLIACLCLMALGFGLGYGLRYMMSYGAFAGYTNDIGLRSVRAVETRIPDDHSFKAIEVYVKRNAHTTECIVFGVIFAEANDYTPTYYRLIINNSDLKGEIFLPFNQTRYNELINSGDPQERLTAATMMGHYESFRLSLSEINSGNPRWEQADIAFINKQLLSYR
jgi:hypothetical protein